MEKNQRKIHLSGPLGKLLEQGEIRKVEPKKNINAHEGAETYDEKQRKRLFKTKSGIEFQSNELIYVDPKECIPWQYANRQKFEYSNIEELIVSIKENGQLQPALVRKSCTKEGNIKYEVIFGCRRYFACMNLGIPFLVILKEIKNTKEAIVAQDAENKYRKNISYYSNSLLYQRLLNDKVFSSEKELAGKLHISTSNLNEVMIFTKIPEDIAKLIPNMHLLSKNFAACIIELSKKSKKHHRYLLTLASEVGQTISSPNKLRKKIELLAGNDKEPIGKKRNKQYCSAKNGGRLFTFKYDHRGAASIVFSKKLICNETKFETLCTVVKKILDNEEGNPDIRIESNIEKEG